MVDVGVTCSQSIGNSAARLLFLTHNVPSTVAARVFFHATKRRATEFERAVYESRTDSVHGEIGEPA